MTKVRVFDNMEVFLIVWFAVFGFTALVFEPLYYFGCAWDGLSCPAAQSSTLMKHVQAIWHIYCQWDPLFYNPPLWLRVLCSIEVFLFGPLYCVIVYGLLYKLKWIAPLAYGFSGALIYSTIVYFLMEYYENLPNTNFVAVFLVNCPWTFVPMVLIYHQLTTVPRTNHGQVTNDDHRKQR